MPQIGHSLCRSGACPLFQKPPTQYLAFPYRSKITFSGYFEIMQYAQDVVFQERVGGGL